MTVVRIVHASMQFSDNKEQHAHDARAIFDRASTKDVWAMTGTEAGDTRGNHDLHDLLQREAQRHNFAIYAQRYGDWVALNKARFTGIRHGYEGPFVQGSHGLTAAQGGHSPRGITWMQGRSRGTGDGAIGTLTFGCAHYLTQGSIKAGGVSNIALKAGIGAFGRRFGGGAGKAFFGADTNEHDGEVDVFSGRPFTTCWDELKMHPATYGSPGHGPTIDVIASYDSDRRVKAKFANVITDADLFLHTDHFMIEAFYEVGVK